MFERYSDEARSIVCAARSEAGRLGSQCLEPEHMLLALIKNQPQALENRLSLPARALRDLCAAIEERSPAAQGKPPIADTADLPVSEEGEAVLARTAREAASEDSPEITLDHLLLALRDEDSPAAQFLRDQEAETESASPKAPSLASTLYRLSEIIRTTPAKLYRLDPEQASKPQKADGWSAKQELGHVIDSASNNHQRFVRALNQTELTFPPYEQESWVNAQSYEHAPWPTLVQFWTYYNLHLLRLIAKIPEDKIETPCTIGKNEPNTLGGLVVGYVDHLEHHLGHILGAHERH